MTEEASSRDMSCGPSRECEAERALRSLINNLPDNVARWDTEGRYLLVNAVHERTLGKSAGEVIGKRICEAFPDGRFAPVEKAIAQVIATGQAISSVRQPVPTENGEMQIHEVSLVPERSAEGKIVSVLCIGRDMTERYHPEDLPVLLKAVEESEKTMEPGRIEIRILHPKKGERWVEIRSTPQRQADGATEWHGLMVEVTERKHMEESLRGQANLQNTLLNAINAAGMQLMMIENGRVIHVGNRELSREFGYTDEELAAHPSLLDLIHPDDRALVAENYRRRLAGEDAPKSYEAGLITRDGQRREYDISIAMVPGTDPVRIVTIGRDITARKKAEQNLNLRDFTLNHIQEEVLLLREDGSIAYANEASCRGLGYSHEELLGLRVFDLDPDATLEQWPDLLRNIKAQGAITIESRHVRKDGTIYPVEVTINHFEFGGAKYTMGVARDITESNASKAALAHERDLLRTLLENSPDYIYFKDIQSRFITASAAIARHFGASSPEELVGKTDSDFFAEEHARQAFEDEAKIISSGQPITGRVEKETWDDGRRESWTLTSKMPLRNNEGEIIGTFGISKNITAIKESEKSLRRLNRNLRMLSACNETLVHAESETEILHSICRIIVELGEYRMAWVGFAEEDEQKSIRPAAWDGHEEGYLARLNLTWDDTERGRGPVGRCIRSGKAQVAQDFQSYPELSLWREAALERGYRSAIALPLRDDSGTYGILGIYASEPDSFHEEEIKLLRELSDNLSYGIGSLQTRKALAESEVALNRAQSIAHIGSFQQDVLQNKFTYSEETARIFGLHGETSMTLEAVISKIHPEDQERVLKALLAALQGASNNIEYRIPADDQIKWVHGRAEVLLDASGKAIQAIGTVQDITERKQIEEKMNQTLLLAQKANAAKSEFLANMSHEIRTPMNGVIGVVEMLKETALNDEQESYVHMIESSGTWLLSLVNDLLDLAKIEEGKIELETGDFNLGVLLEDFAGIFKLRASEQGLHFAYTMDPDVPLHLQGDASRLRQIIGNLAGNAVKFTGKGTITLKVQLQESLPPESILLRFSIQDSGMGIPADQQENIFNAFTQVDSSASRKHKGTGLGLAIAKKLVTLMGGEIGVISEPGKGSEFWFTARFGRMEAGSWELGRGGKGRLRCFFPSFRLPASILPTSAERAAFRILLAEDNITNQRVALFLLKKLGFLLTDAVVNGLEVLQALREKEYDLVLMDVQMPEMDGFEATRQIRDPQSEVRSHDLPILAITAHALTGYEEKCLESGMNGYLAKPINLSALGEALNKWVVRKGERKSEVGGQKSV